MHHSHFLNPNYKQLGGTFQQTVGKMTANAWTLIATSKENWILSLIQ